MENSRDRAKRKGETFLIPVDQIVVNESDNNRMDYGDIESLANSLLNSGQLIPIRVQKLVGEDKYVVKDGFRRMRAIKSLLERGEEFPYVECRMTPKGYKEEDGLFDQIIANDGKPLSQLEEGSVYKLLCLKGFNETEISKRVGKPLSHIRTCISVANLPKKMQNAIAEGTLSGSTAVEIYKSVNGDETKAVEAMEEAVATKKTETGAEKVKVKPKDVKTIKAKSAIKKLEELCEAFNENGLKNSRTELTKKLFSRLKAGCEVKDLLELFE